MRALLLIDLQDDFMPGGALPVEDGNATVLVANRLMDRFDFVTASQDWHPADHMSFASQHPGHKTFERIQINDRQQTLWPDHCIQGSPGAELHHELRTGSIDRVIRKGTDRRFDSYSAFFDDGKQSTGLDVCLREQEVDDIVLMGLATDYCVLFSALDAARLGYRVTVVRDGCRGIDQPAGHVKVAWSRMQDAGVLLIDSKDLD